MEHYLLRKQPAALMTEIYHCHHLSYYITGRIGRYGDKVFLETLQRGVVSTMTDHHPEYQIHSAGRTVVIHKETAQLFYSPSHQWYMIGHKQGRFDIYHHFHKIAQLYRPDPKNLDVYAFDIMDSVHDDALLLLAYLLCQQQTVKKPATASLPMRATGVSLSLYQHSPYVVNDHNRDH